MSIETILDLALLPKLKLLSLEEQAQFINKLVTEVRAVTDYNHFYSPEIAEIIVKMTEADNFPCNSEVERIAIEELFPQGSPSLGTLIYSSQRFVTARKVTHEVARFQTVMSKWGYNPTREIILARLTTSRADVEICFFLYQVQAGKIKKDNSGAFYLMPKGNRRRGYPLNLKEWVKLAKDGVSATQKHEAAPKFYELSIG